ncbi:hypothetical protein BJV77DRAFT_351604 [Russula vinacea]|nr:hypothetical protein BJV77DRAFT_351604 [Russula vinacea]
MEGTNNTGSTQPVPSAVQRNHFERISDLAGMSELQCGARRPPQLWTTPLERCRSSYILGVIMPVMRSRHLSMLGRTQAPVTLVRPSPDPAVLEQRRRVASILELGSYMRLALANHRIPHYLLSPLYPRRPSPLHHDLVEDFLTPNALHARYHGSWVIASLCMAYIAWHPSMRITPGITFVLLVGVVLGGALGERKGWHVERAFHEHDVY